MCTVQIRGSERLEAPGERESDLAELVSVPTFKTAAVVAHMRRVRTQVVLANALTTVLRSRGMAS